MTFKKIALTTIVLLFSINVNASLIGDTVTSQHYFPDNSTPYIFDQLTTTVQAGTADAMCPFLNQCFRYSVNVDASTVTLNYAPNGLGGGESFNGVFIDSLNDSSGNSLLGVSVSTNIDNWDSSMLSFDGDSIWINLINPYSEFELETGEVVLSLDFATSSVPVPAAVWLFGSGLLGLVGVARRKKA